MLTPEDGVWKLLRKVWEQSLREASAINQPIDIQWFELLRTYEAVKTRAHYILREIWDDVMKDGNVWLNVAAVDIGIGETAAKALFTVVNCLKCW